MIFFGITDVKLNDTTLSLYSYDPDGSPSAEPEGGYAGTVTKTGTGTLEFMDVRRQRKSES